jgi:hypothetical protein
MENTIFGTIKVMVVMGLIFLAVWAVVYFQMGA